MNQTAADRTRDEAGSIPMVILGLCPAVAVAARVVDALWMAAGVLLVLVLSSVARSVLAARVDAASPSETPEPWLRALVITSVLTSAFEVGLMWIAPEASAALGIYAPLIAVNLLVIAPRTSEAESTSLLGGVARATGEGLLFAAGLVLIALVREILGAGTVTLFRGGGFGGTIVIQPLLEQPARAFGYAGGGLLCLGYLAAAARALARRRGGHVDRRGLPPGAEGPA